MYVKLVRSVNLPEESACFVTVPWPGGRGIAVVASFAGSGDFTFRVDVKSVVTPWADISGTPLAFPTLTGAASGQYAFDLPPCVLEVVTQTETGAALQVNELSLYRTS